MYRRRAQLDGNRHFRLQLCQSDKFRHDVARKTDLHSCRRCRAVYDCVAVRVAFPHGRKLSMRKQAQLRQLRTQKLQQLELQIKNENRRILWQFSFFILK